MMNIETSKTMFSSARAGGRDDWETPQKLFNALDITFNFTLDPCASDSNHKCKKYFTEKEDGLTKDWSGNSVFVNPPYSKNKNWVKKCWEEGQKDGTKVVLLIPSRTDTIYWHDYCLRAEEIHFIKGRLCFEFNGSPNLSKGKASRAPFPSAIVVFYKNEFTRFYGPRIFTMEKE